MPFLQHARRLIDHASLDHMIAPFLIRAIYWIGIAVIVSAGLGTLISDGDAPGILLTLAGIALALLCWRLFCELLILAFNIHARLAEIRDLLTYRQARHDAHRNKNVSVPSLKSPRLNTLPTAPNDEAQIRS